MQTGQNVVFDEVVIVVNTAKNAARATTARNARKVNLGKRLASRLASHALWVSIRTTRGRTIVNNAPRQSTPMSGRKVAQIVPREMKYARNAPMESFLLLEMHA